MATKFPMTLEDLQLTDEEILNLLYQLYRLDQSREEEYSGLRARKTLRLELDEAV